MFNTIILQKGEARLTTGEHKSFNKGDTIWGNDRETEEIKRWPIEQEQSAREELKKHTCTYKEDIALYNVEEYALEFCECNEDGEFVEGSDYELAEEAVKDAN